MKNILIATIISGLACVLAAAQRPDSATRARMDTAFARHAFMMTLSTEKTLLEPSEATSIIVGVMLNPVINSDGEITSLPEFVPLTPGPDSPYKITNWRVVEGGGSIITVDDGAASYTAPRTAPAGRTMTVSVDLVPQMTGFAKVVLLQKLYFVQDDNAIYVNMPEIGLNAAKYVSNTNGGAKVPTMQGVDPRAAASMSPELRAKMAQAQAAMAASQGSSGINLAAVSSNAMSLYDPENDQTAIKFTSLNMQMADGGPASSPGMDAIFMFNYKGKAVGTHPFTDDGTGAGFYITAANTGVGCGVNFKANTSIPLPCTGSVIITSVDDKFVRGTIRTAVWTSVGSSVFRGYLYGKFKVNRAR
jgi:hypothetical protein